MTQTYNKGVTELIDTPEHRNAIKSCKLIKALLPHLDFFVYYQESVAYIKCEDVLADVCKKPGGHANKTKVVFLWELCGEFFRKPFPLCKAVFILFADLFQAEIDAKDSTADGWRLIRVVDKRHTPVHVYTLRDYFKECVITGKRVFVDKPYIGDRIDSSKAFNVKPERTLRVYNQGLINKYQPIFKELQARLPRAEEKDRAVDIVRKKKRRLLKPTIAEEGRLQEESLLQNLDTHTYASALEEAQRVLRIDQERFIDIYRAVQAFLGSNGLARNFN